MNKITIIDGNSLLFRSYYATAYPGVEIMRSQDGTPTNAIFAFSNMMNKIVSSLNKDECILVAFDAGKHNFRHESLETYKANRKPAPTELVQQFPLARDFLKAFGIYQFEEVGFEGDDIAGTAARTAQKEGYEVHIYTSDRDFLQLVDKNIYVHIIKKGLSDVAIMTPDKVKEDYGFEPLQIIDYKGLRGDTSDNLPGIPGIGEKTAVKLIQEYGNFDNIIANADNIKGKVGEAIKEHQEIGKISRDLAIIKTDIELPFKIDETRYQGYDFTSINTFCQKYGLKQFISKLNPKWKIKTQTYEDIEVKIVHSFKDINLNKEFAIALDYQDDDYTNTEVYGIAIYDEQDAYYININEAKNDETFLSILRNKDYQKICFDYKAIKVALSRYGIIIDGLSFDLLLAAYLLDSSIKNDVVSVMHLFNIDYSEDNDEEVSLFSSENPNKTAKLAYYSKKVAKTASIELAKINNDKLYKELELPLADTLADMEIEGFPIDIKTLTAFGKVFKERMEALAKEIYELAGEQFNIQSPKQLADILYNKLGLDANKKMSTSFDNLKYLVDQHPIIEKIIEYRKYAKLVSTYIDGLKNHIHEDGKFHAKFNQAQTTTGRLSSSEPNLQNISVRDEEGKLIRKAFYYPNHEYEILSLDYSQIELRVLASLSNCQALKEIFQNREDIHSATARKIFNLNKEPTPAQRRKAKTVNFGIVYGISDWGLAEQLEVPVYEAKEIIKNFYASYPEIAQFFNEIIAGVMKNGYVETLFGRRRYLREINDSNYQTREFAKRAAMNAPIQGTAADLIKVAMILVNKALKEGNYESKMVLQIHDELIFKIKREEKDEIYKLVKDIMEHALKLEVPLEVDGGFGEDWYQAK